MSDKNEVRLTGDQRQFLVTLVRRGNCAVSVLTRAHILLAADVGEAAPEHSDDYIAQALSTSPSTVFRVRKRFAKNGLLWALLAKGRQPQRPLLPQCDA